MALSKKNTKKLKQAFLKFNTKLVLTREKLRKAANRANAAHVMMISFVSCNSVGAWMIAPQYGLITAGVCSGLYGYLLGNE